MRLILVVLLICSFSLPCLGDVVLHRYYETSSGDEMGLANSGVSGAPALSNPDWTVEVIAESERAFYKDKKKTERAAKDKTKKDAQKALRKDIKDKLKGLGFSQSEVDEIVGESD